MPTRNGEKLEAAGEQRTVLVDAAAHRRNETEQMKPILRRLRHPVEPVAVEQQALRFLGGHRRRGRFAAAAGGAQGGEAKQGGGDSTAQ